MTLTQSSIIVYVLLATFIPVLIFSASAMLAAGPKIKNQEELADDFLLAGRNLSVGDFVNSSTGYMLQVSTTFYFIYWGYNYGFSNIFYLLSWAAGILVFGAFARRLVELRVDYSTLPYLLSGDSDRVVRTLASIATVASFIGVFYVEAYFAADLITGAAGLQVRDATSDSASGQWWIIFIMISTVTAAYSMLGGLRKVVANDLYQLAFSYVGLNTVFALLVHKAFERSGSGGLLTALICIGIMLTILLTDRRIFEGWVKGVAVIGSIAVVGGVLLFNLPTANLSDPLPDIPGLFKQISEPWGWFTLLGFTITNIAWQFSDSSVFQRIAALKLSENKDKAELEVKRALRSLAIVSPITWGMGIVLGMLIRAAGVGVSEPGTEYFQLVEFLRSAAISGNELALIALLAMVIGLVSIMMSTVDVAIIAAIQTTLTDLRDRKGFRAWQPAVLGALFLALVILLAVIHKNQPDSSILTVMAGAYASLILLAPLTVAKLLKRRIEAGFAVVAILAGLAGTILGTFWPFGALPDNVKLVLPIFLSIGPAALVVLIGSLRSSRN